MRKTVYIETSIPSYLTSRPSRDVRAAAWQQLTNEWWEKARPLYDLVTSELVLAEAARGNREAAKKRLDILEGIPELVIDKETESLAQKLLEEGGIAVAAKADALHVAVAAVHEVDYLLTWNCRHIDNATMKPRMRAICASAGYLCAEICTPLELLAEEIDDVP